MLTENRKFIFVTTIVIILFFVLSIFSVFFLNTWFDEANLGYKAWLTGENLASPFVDFTMKYPPVAFYSQVFLQDLFGPSLFTGRLFSVFFSVTVSHGTFLPYK